MSRFIGLLLLIASTLAAAEQPMPKVWDFAEEKKQQCSNGNMSEMNSCLANAYTESDARLNLEYKRLMNSLANPASLRKSQIAWMKFRDLQCSFEVPPSWEGSGVPYSRRSCLIDHTERRIRDLERVKPCNGCVEFKAEFYGTK